MQPQTNVNQDLTLSQRGSTADVFMNSGIASVLNDDTIVANQSAGLTNSVYA